MDFDWDESKTIYNSKKHGVTFSEATDVFGNELSFFVADPDHAYGEERFLLFGQSEREQHLVVFFTERAEIIRIISARHMTPTRLDAGSAASARA